MISGMGITDNDMVSFFGNSRHIFLSVILQTILPFGVSAPSLKPLYVGCSETNLTSLSIHGSHGDSSNRLIYQIVQTEPLSLMCLVVETPMRVGN